MDIATALAGLGILAGLAGILVPVIPGLILVVASVTIWAFVVQDPVGWAVLGVAAAIAAVGWTLQYVIPTRRLREAGVPTRTLVFGAVGGVVGIFVLPGVGLFVGFFVGVLLAEMARHSSLAAAWPSAKRALIAAATSVGIELCAGMLIAVTFAVGAWRFVG